MDLLRIRSFPTLISCLFFSKVGDYAYELIFIFIVLETTNNDYFITGLIYFFRFIPFIFFGPIGGWRADNRNIKKNLLFSEIIRFLVSAILLFAYMNESTNIIILVIASIFTTIGRSIFQPSFQTSIPKIMEDKNIPLANSTIQIIEEIASVLGPLLCSFILLISDKQSVLLFNFITYLISIIIIFNLDIASENTKTIFSIPKIYKETSSNIQNMYHSEYGLFITIIGSAICILFTGSVIRFIIPAVSIHMGQNETFTSYIFSLIAAGTVVGGIIYNKLIPKATPYKLMLFWFIYGIIMLIMSLSPIRFILPFGFILGIYGAFVDITLITTIQAYSKKENIGKNFGAFSTLANTAEALSGLVSGIIASIGIVFSFIMMTLLIALTGLFGMMLTSRKQ
ncbi:MAG: MFS transporter [Neisseriaceae bacterium]|nr:MAG: MFS transporter [Neisseriaceae bacterium]